MPDPIQPPRHAPEYSEGCHLVPPGVATVGRHSVRPSQDHVGKETDMDLNDRMARIEDAVIDLAIVVSEGHLSHLVSANISLDVLNAGRRLQAFHQEVASERGS